MSENDSNVTAQKEYKVELQDGQILIEGISGFSIDVEDPKLNVGKLYAGLFGGIDRPTMIALRPSNGLQQNSKAFSFFKSLEKIVGGACEKMNPELAEIAQKSDRLESGLSE